VRRRIFSAIYDSIKIVASAVVGATFALAIREDFTLNTEVTGFSIVAVILALLCSHESQRLEEAENVNWLFIVTFIMAIGFAIGIAYWANSINIMS
jgi:uncharacterized membrane protein